LTYTATILSLLCASLKFLSPKDLCKTAALLNLGYSVVVSGYPVVVSGYPVVVTGYPVVVVISVKKDSSVNTSTASSTVWPREVAATRRNTAHQTTAWLANLQHKEKIFPMSASI